MRRNRFVYFRRQQAIRNILQTVSLPPFFRQSLCRPKMHKDACFWRKVAWKWSWSELSGLSLKWCDDIRKLSLLQRSMEPQTVWWRRFVSNKHAKLAHKEPAVCWCPKSQQQKVYLAECFCEGPSAPASSRSRVTRQCLDISTRAHKLWELERKIMTLMALNKK